MSRLAPVPHVDPCAIAIPQRLIHFDPSARASAEFRHPVKTDVDPPFLNRVFTTFFNIYLFQLHSDIVQNLNDTGRGRPTDVRDALVHAQTALRTYYSDSTIRVTNYSLGYSHLDRVRGSRYIFHLKSSNFSNPVRHDVAALQRTFDGKCYISVKEYSADIFERAVYMVVPYSKRPKRLKWFLNQFDSLRNNNVNIELKLSVCNDFEEDLSTVQQLVQEMQHSEHVQVILVPGDGTGFFSRAISIRDGSKDVPKDSLMFVCDIDMYIFPSMFESCRYNTIQGSQVYFPVFYSLYARQARIARNGGYWRDSSFGMGCMYKSDFDEVAAYNKASKIFVGWGGEDLVLCQAFLSHNRYEVFRAIEPALRHKWHVKHCEALTPAYDDCMSVKFQQLGQMSTVGKLLLDNKFDAQQLFAQFHEEDSDEGVPSTLGDLDRKEN